MAAPSASALEDVAAVLRLHAHAKAVRFLTVSIVGLIGSFHLTLPEMSRTSEYTRRRAERVCRI